MCARARPASRSASTSNIRVISTATLAPGRSWPPSNTLLALGALLLGLGAGTGIVLLHPAGDGGAWPPSARRPGAADRQPAEPADRGPQAVPALPSLPSLPVLAVLPRVVGPQRSNALADLKSRLAVEMRKVHDAVRASHDKRTRPSILIISPDEDDATAVALNLASVAAATQQVLLIDVDLHRRTLSAIVPDQTQGGLVDVAVGRKTLAEVVIRHQQSNINLLPFVSANSQRRGNINDDDIRKAFEQTKQFDLVIVAARNFDRDPSARFFAGLVDHIVLVGQAGAAGKAEIEQAIAALGVDARNVRGTVLTGARAA